MPVSKSPLEYYRYYCASQRRVEQWVQDTEHQLQQCQDSQSNSVQWRGFLEDPGLATPVSISSPLDQSISRKSGKNQEAFEIRQVHCPVADVVNQLDKGVDQNSPRRRRTSPALKDSGGPNSQSRPSSKDDVTVPPGSSKHSKHSTHSGQTSKSKLSHSSSRKRSRKEDGEANRSILLYVPYGIILLLFAMTTGMSPVSLAATSIILVGYFCLDYNGQESRSRRRRHDS